MLILISVYIKDHNNAMFVLIGYVERGVHGHNTMEAYKHAHAYFVIVCHRLVLLRDLIFA